MLKFDVFNYKRRNPRVEINVRLMIWRSSCLSRPRRKCLSPWSIAPARHNPPRLFEDCSNADVPSKSVVRRSGSGPPIVVVRLSGSRLMNVIADADDFVQVLGDLDRLVSEILYPGTVPGHCIGDDSREIFQRHCCVRTRRILILLFVVTDEQLQSSSHEHPFPVRSLLANRVPCAIAARSRSHPPIFSVVCYRVSQRCPSSKIPIVRDSEDWEFIGHRKTVRRFTQFSVQVRRRLISTRWGKFCRSNRGSSGSEGCHVSLFIREEENIRPRIRAAITDCLSNVTLPGCRRNMASVTSVVVTIRSPHDS